VPDEGPVIVAQFTADPEFVTEYVRVPHKVGIPAVVAAESTTSLNVFVTEPPTRRPVTSEIVGIVSVVEVHGFVKSRVQTTSVVTVDVRATENLNV